MPEVTKDLLVSILEEIALLLQLKGENAFKIRAYRNGAEIVQSFDGDILARAKENDLKEIPGIGDALQQKLHELASTGELEFHKKLRAEFPETIFELFEVQGLGAKKIKALYDKLEVDSIQKLKQVCESGEVSELSGFGKKTVENILKAIADREKHSGFHLHGKIAPIAETILERLKEHPKVSQACICGSYRRGKEVSHDLDFLVATNTPEELTQFFSQLEEVEDILSCGSTKSSVKLLDGLQCDLRAVSNEQYPFAQQYFTGSKEHNVAVRQKALSLGLSLNEYGFTAKTDGTELPSVHTEPEIYQALGMDYIQPELRENRGEIEAAEQQALPKLIELENLRGTFHNHTTASDGRNSLQEMAEAAREHGLQYLGIADHSKSSFQANGLNEERLLAQIEEIQKLNETFDDFRIFTGSEVDILKDGSLDFEDSVLSQLDYCVASVHQAFTLSEEEMTKRLIKAIENPHVTMLGHVTGRLLLRRKEYAINLDKIIDCAAETETIIELNCSTSRADMDWRWWKKARDKGVKCSINPDAHRVSQFQNLAFGVKWARKGWLRKEDVVNCLSVEDVAALMKVSS